MNLVNPVIQTVEIAWLQVDNAKTAHLDSKSTELHVRPVSIIPSLQEELLTAQLVTVHAKLVIVLMEIVHLASLDLDLIISLFSVLPAILQLSQKELLLVLTATIHVLLVVK